MLWLPLLGILLNYIFRFIFGRVIRETRDDLLVDLDFGPVP
jgi:hypothetical protein